MAENAQILRLPLVFHDARGNQWRLIVDDQGRLCFQVRRQGEWFTEVQMIQDGVTINL